MARNLCAIAVENKQQTNDYCVLNKIMVLTVTVSDIISDSDMVFSFNDDREYVSGS